MAASEFNYAPSRGFVTETTPRVAVATFGDGYSQRVAQGINSLNQVWNLEFRSTSMTTINAIVSYFSTKNGVTPFWWLPPEGTENQDEVLVVCTKWSRTYESNISAGVSATFERIYAP
jgi:phage-related protein